jgi:hypothetical protein
MARKVAQYAHGVRLLVTMMLVGLAGLGGIPRAASAAARLELRLERDRLEATVTGEPMHEPVFLKDLKHQRRVLATSVKAGPGPDQFTATFDADSLEGDGKPRDFAIEWREEEVARTTFVLPAMPEPSSLSYLVIIGPLMGLVMITIAVLIGRKTLKRAMASEPRRRPFQGE